MTTVPVAREEAAMSRAEAVPFEAFVRARLPQLMRFGLALTADDQAAADLVQDALERAFVRWRSIRCDNPEGYVRRTMVNRHISVWRRRSRERTVAEVPEQSYVDEYRDQQVFTALRQLAPRQRAVIALRYYADLTEAQTALVMGCSVGTVKRQAHDAIAHLRTALGEWEES
ncbi:SigE family RNA polymerase sigma factor [Ornithinimicrobium cerasi]|uniref:RNA polymerase sigma-70 factor, sigma-E family n=1 Tax=Ornithinimicrobium cerasi TaxID=2248773 RepID=A0A285VTJ5_9MICO|nr:SigE family RNA polymerase sigma factor [Ornithinimicrobium cerasi]SOC57400.1 RNA polymerase sigma-70 factor, sigma-E family [Ornithinimicrobium cerasi]